jgi:hypothetical protein
MSIAFMSCVYTYECILKLNVCVFPASSASDLSAPATPNLNKTRVNESPNVDVAPTVITIADSDHQESKNNAGSGSVSRKEKRKRESKADLYR